MASASSAARPAPTLSLRSPAAHAASVSPVAITAVLTPNGKDVCILSTYGSLFEKVNDDEFKCKICVARATVTGDDVSTISCAGGKKNLHNLVVHLARCCCAVLCERHLNTESVQAAIKNARVTKRAAESPVRGPVDARASPFVIQSLSALDIAIWLLSDMLPLSTAETPAFAALLARAKVKGAALSARSIAREVPTLLEAVRRILKYLTHASLSPPLGAAPLGRHTRYALTLDGWTSRAGKPFLGVTIHFVDEGFKLYSCALGLAEFKGGHSAVDHRVILEEVCGGYGLPLEMLMAVTTDNAATMVKCFSNGSLGVHIRCVAHTLNLVCKDIKLSGLLKDALALARHFSAIAVSRNAVVKEAAAAANKPYHAPILPVVTRWSSDFDALERHMLRWPYVKGILPKDLGLEGAAKTKYTELLVECLKNHEMYEDVVTTLRPLALWTTRVQASSTPMLSFGFEMYEDILAGLSVMPGAPPLQPEVVALREELETAIKARFARQLKPPPLSAFTVNLADLAGDALNEARQRLPWRDTWLFYVFAALLDVRTVCRFTQSVRWKFMVMPEYWPHILSSLEALSLRLDPPAPLSAPAAADKVYGFFPPVRGGASQLSRADLIHAELADFTNAAGLKTQDLTEDERHALDPLGFWREVAGDGKFVYLSHVARSVLAVQISSAASERLFSVSNNICSIKRTRLSAATLEAATMVRSAAQNNFPLLAELQTMSSEKRLAKDRATEPAAKKARATSTASAGASKNNTCSDDDDDDGAQYANEDDEDVVVKDGNVIYVDEEGGEGEGVEAQEAD